MTRPKRPDSFRKLTPREHIEWTPRARKFPIPPPDEMEHMLSQAANFNNRLGARDLETFKIWWRHTTEYKTREDFLRAWFYNTTFMRLYAEWREIATIDKKVRYYNFDEDKDEREPPADLAYADEENLDK